MHVTALVKAPDHVCCRYRLAAFRPAFERAGCTLELRPWPARWLSRLLLRRELGSPDVLVLQRRLPPLWLLPLLRRVAPLLVFDFDDAVFLRDSYSPRGCACPRRARAFAAVVRAADLVVAGNSFLADQASLWTAADKVRQVPTCVDLGRYAPAEHTRVGPAARLVWIGCGSTLRGLARARAVLEGLGERLPGLGLKIICDRFLSLRRLRVLPCPWAEQTEAQELRQADIGISWLPDDLWSRGKCALKVLQYMAAGLPVVANPVGLQAGLVRHGETGFLARTAEEWARAVARLAEDPDLRHRLGRQGRQVAQERYGLPVGQACWARLLGELRRGGVARPAPAGEGGQSPSGAAAAPGVVY
jgi:glycosyltransferase involved in cell wall biosynthesis